MLATIAEHWRGAAQDVRDAVCVLAGNRVAAGVLIGGRLQSASRPGPSASPSNGRPRTFSPMGCR
ncbi:hypothetical protein [Actinoallomurus purpureus]|uniref:hypothetical protein n=1 Tax=Actinoallomurus purpureus TaxID=478114 RepID=UPI002093879E|nr:hypothetical protein [Actinoallomurus purpureus]